MSMLWLGLVGEDDTVPLPLRHKEVPTGWLLGNCKVPVPSKVAQNGLIMSPELL